MYRSLTLCALYNLKFVVDHTDESAAGMKLVGCQRDVHGYGCLIAVKLDPWPGVTRVSSHHHLHTEVLRIKIAAQPTWQREGSCSLLLANQSCKLLDRQIALVLRC